MCRTDNIANADILPASLRQPGQTNLIRFALTNSVVGSILTSTAVPTLFLLQMGARDFYIGVLVTLFAIAPLGTRLRSMEVGVPLLVGYYLGEHPSLQKFVMPFSMALLAMIAGNFILRRIPEIPPAAPEVNLGLRLRLASRPTSVRRCVAFTAMLTFVYFLCFPFWVVLLTANKNNPFPGLPTGYVVWLVATAAAGNVLGLKFWAYLVDKHGGRPVLTLSSLGAAAIAAGWLFLPEGRTPLLLWSLAFYLAWGFLDGGSLMGRTWVMMRSVPAVYQTDGFSIINLAGALGGAVGGLAGGAMFDWMTQLTRIQSPGGIDLRKPYLLLVQLGFVGVYLLSRRLANHHRQTPTRQIMAELWRKIARQEMTGT